MGKIVLIQPCFFPWRGQIDLISKSDITVFLDNVQYVRRSWYNRNQIRGYNGEPLWITVPVQTKGNYNSLIKDIKINNNQKWQKNILNCIWHSYKKAPFFDNYYYQIDEVLNRPWEYISDLSQETVKWCFSVLNLKQKFFKSSDINVHENDAVTRLVKICKKLNADEYISGPSAKDYITDEKIFMNEGVKLTWMNYKYSNYKNYQNKISTENFSILDLLFNFGDETRNYIGGNNVSY